MDVAYFGNRRDLPDHVAELARELEERASSLRSTEDERGGLRRHDLLAALASVVRGRRMGVPDGETFAAAEIDLVGATSHVALSVQAGRARANNAAVLAVLGAASMAEVRWLIIVLPAQYKGSTVAAAVARDILMLTRAEGIRLDLEGVVTVAY